MNILGIAAPFGHDASAAIIVDGKVVAAAEEERFTRKKHADGQRPVNAINYCLEQANLKPSDINHVAYPWSIEPINQKKFQYFFKKVRTRPSRAFKKVFKAPKLYRNHQTFIRESLEGCGIKTDAVNLHWVEHQLAHVASSFYFSGMKEAAVLSIDAGGEITCTLLGEVKNGSIEKIKEVLNVDSLGNFYSTMTDYLGFNRGDGEYKVMGMAPFGDPTKINFDHILWWNDKIKSYQSNDDYIWVRRRDRARVDKVYSKRMITEFAPEREGDALSEPYIHIAAVTQKKLEDITVKLVDTYLKESLNRHGNLCFAGGCALNVALNRILLELPYLKRLWVQPAANDAGTSLGAAAYVAHELGQELQPMKHSYLGPEYSNEEIEEELKKWNYSYSREQDICQEAANLLDKGEILAWFQGRMEWGPRALGNRSIIGNPTIKGTADKINAIIKFREQWRPFCPSILKEHAQEILGSDHPAPFMTIAFKATSQWKDRIPEVVHVDGTCRPQLVKESTNPRYYRLIKNFYQKTQVPLVINTSLNRRGEPMVCSPQDAMVMFEESGLKFMAIGDFLVKKGK